MPLPKSLLQIRHLFVVAVGFVVVIRVADAGAVAKIHAIHSSHAAWEQVYSGERESVKMPHYSIGYNY